MKAVKQLKSRPSFDILVLVYTYISHTISCIIVNGGVIMNPHRRILDSDTPISDLRFAPAKKS